MKIKRVQKYVCFLLMLFISLSGMCHGLVQADFIFACAEKNTSVISRVEDKLGDQDAYVEEETGVGEVYGTVLRSRRSRSEESFARVEGLLQVPENLSGNSQVQSGSTDVGILKENLSSTVVIEYVHHQDGAKS